MDDDVYYRPLFGRDGLVTLACMQWFDEFDYDEKRFLRDEDGQRYRFADGKEAAAWLNAHVKPDLIDPQYRAYGQSWRKEE